MFITFAIVWFVLGLIVGFSDIKDGREVGIAAYSYLIISQIWAVGGFLSN